METMNKYVVRAETKEASESLDLELASESSSSNVPDRKVEVLRERQENPVMTDWFLTDEEAAELEKDGRVKYVKKKVENLTVSTDTIQETLGYSFDEGGAYSGSSTYSDHVLLSKSNKDVRNYGLHAHSVANTNKAERDGLHTKIDLPDYTIPEGESGAGEVYQTGHNNYVSEVPFKQKYTGEGVDVIIMDTGFDCSHPEWEDSNGVSRLQEIDWFAETGIQGTMPPDYYAGNDPISHGTHVASIAAGKKHGWAKAAHLYFINLIKFIDADPANGMATAFELVEAFCRQNTNGRPKVVNMSFHVSTDPLLGANRHQQIAGGTYRGTAWTNPYLFNWNNNQGMIDWDFRINGNSGSSHQFDTRDIADAPIYNWEGELETWNHMNRWTGFNPYESREHQQLLNVNYGVPYINDFASLRVAYPNNAFSYTDPDIDNSLRTPADTLYVGRVGTTWNNILSTDLTEINDLVDSMCDHASVCLAAGNESQYLTVEDNAHITCDRYEGDPSADWDNTIYEFVKEETPYWLNSPKEVMAMPSEEGDAGVEKREYYYHRKQPPYSHKAYTVGWLDFPKIGGGVFKEQLNRRSNYGAAVNCYGYGQYIVAGISRGRNTASIITGEYEEGSTYRYEAFSGTSMASPQVAGITACYAEAYPDLTPLEIREQVLRDSKKNVAGRFSASNAVDLRNKHWHKLFDVTDSSQIYRNPEFLQFISTTPDSGQGYDGFYYGSFHELDALFYENRVPFYPWRHTELEIENKITIHSGDYTANTILSTPTSPAIWYQPVEIEIQLKDGNNDTVDTSTLPLELTHTRGTLSDVTFSNGLYKATYTPEYEAYDETIEAYLYGQKIGNTLQFTTESGALPVITSNSMISIPEDAQNGDLIHTFTSDFGQVYVAAGADRLFFTLDQNTGELRLAHDPDFVTNPIFNFMVLTSGYNVNSIDQSFTVNVTDATPPVISLTNIDVVNTADTYASTSGTRVVRYDENTHIDLRILTASSTDNSGSSSISLGSNSHPAFYLTGNDLYINEMDAETSSVYFANINATDAEGNVETQSVWVRPYQVDDTAPYFTSSTLANAVQEHTKQNQLIYDANGYDSTADSTNQVITFSISNDYNFTNWLSINSSTGQVTLLHDVEYDDSSLIDHNILVELKAEDDSGNFSTQTVTIPILERDHTAPVITSALGASASLDENNAAGVVVHTVTANEAVTFEETSGDGLSINSTTGNISLPLVADYETKNSYYISYRVRDVVGNVSAIDAFSLTINDVYEDLTAPVITSTNPATVSFDEHYHGVLHTVTWTEENSTASITKTGGDLNIATNGQVTSTNPLDYETSTSHYVEYDITDEAGNTTSGRVDVNVGDVDDFPVISNAVPNNSGHQIGSVLTNSLAGHWTADKNVSWSFLKDDGSYATSYTKNNTTFTIASDGKVYMTTNGYIDVVAWNGVYSYTVAATADDGQVTHSTTQHTISYTYFGQLYTDYTSFDDSTGTLSVSIPENTSLTDVVGSISVKDYMDEPIEDECTFALTAGNISGKFNWDGNDLKLSSAADYETQTTVYYGEVSITHPTAINKTLPINVTITNVDENDPVFTNGATHTLNSMPENTGNGTQIYAAYATDTGDGTNGNITYSLDTDSSYNSDKLIINPTTGQVILATDANISYSSSYLVNHNLQFKVIATDDAGNTAEQIVSLPISQVAPVIQRATGGNNDAHHVSGNIFEIDANIESTRIAVYSVTNVAAKGVTNNDVTFSITGETTDISIQHQAGSDFVIIHNSGSAFDGSDPQKVITLTCEFSDGASSTVNITINVNSASTGFDLTADWHSVATKTTTSQSDNFSVVEIPYSNGSGGNKNLYLEHKATATTAWQSDFCIGLVQILDANGNLHQNIKPENYQWFSNSYNSATTVSRSSIGSGFSLIMNTSSATSNSGLGRFYIGSATPSGSTGANDGINYSAYNSALLPVGDDTVAQSSGANFLYRECSNPVAHDYVNYAKTQTINYLPQAGSIRIAYLNCGGAGLDGTDSLRITFK